MNGLEMGKGWEPLAYEKNIGKEFKNWLHCSLMEMCVINWLTLPSDRDDGTYLTDCYEIRKNTLCEYT